MFTEFLNAHNLLALLAPREARLAYPPATDRVAWEALSSTIKAQLITRATAFVKKPYPMLTATQFLAYTYTGNRKVYEDPYFARRNKLQAAVLGYCVGHVKSLDAIIDGLWCICEESFWGISAHNGSDHPGQRPPDERPLPDIENPYIDLFAAQTAATLSWACYLLREELNQISPILIRRVRHEINHRIITPFFQHDDFWWMGLVRKDLNNWTPWILANTMTTLLIWESDDLHLCEGLTRAMGMLDRYLATIPEDGGCDEGVSYWNMSGGALLDCLECIYIATRGNVSFYHEPIIHRIGEFPLHAYICGPYFWNFADCDAKPILDGERIFQFGKRIHHSKLMSLGAWVDKQRESLFSHDTPEMSRILARLFSDISEIPCEEPVSSSVTLPQLQVGARKNDRFHAVFKAGHNGENHNHNDVGSFLLYVDGQPAIIDLGNMIYTAKSFSDQRYTLPNTRSYYHNLPIIGSLEQAVGEQHRARNVEWNETGVSMDLCEAYPSDAGILFFIRSASLHEKEGLRITDHMQLKSQLPVNWCFLFRNKPELHTSFALANNVCLEFSNSLVARIDEFCVTDPRMARNFPGSIWRLQLTSTPSFDHQQSFRFF